MLVEKILPTLADLPSENVEHVRERVGAVDIELADKTVAKMLVEATVKIDALYDVERAVKRYKGEINQTAWKVTRRYAQRDDAEGLVESLTLLVKLNPIPEGKTHAQCSADEKRRYNLAAKYLSRANKAIEYYGDRWAEAVAEASSFGEWAKAAPSTRKRAVQTDDGEVEMKAEDAAIKEHGGLNREETRDWVEAMRTMLFDAAENRMLFTEQAEALYHQIRRAAVLCEIKRGVPAPEEEEVTA